MDPRTVLVTGASSGIGRATSLRLAARGHRVVATMRDVGGRNAEAAAVLGDEAEGALHVVELDVTSDASVEAAVAEALDRAGRIDALVANAGILSLGVAEAFTPEELRHPLEVNVVGAFRCARAVLPAMRAGGEGLIVVVSSVAGRVAYPLSAPYIASKWAVEGLFEALRYELAGRGIDVAIVEPGPFATRQGERARAPADADGRAAGYPELRIAGEEITAAFGRLLGDPGAPTDPDLVADAIARLVEAAPGARPLRTVVGVDFGVRALNAAVEPHRRGGLEALGVLSLVEGAPAAGGTP